MLLVLVWSWVAPAAWADGDPASDVLATQTLFLPQDAQVPLAQRAQLARLLQEAGQSGYQIRLALISSPSDLGSITALWRQPATYASFLGEELSLTYRGMLVVIMPDGFGLYDNGHPVSADALGGVPVRGSGAGLAATATQAIQRLSSAAGHPLALPRATAPTSTGSSNDTPWLVFIVGLVLIGLAWAASLRARPLGFGRRDAPAA